MSNNKELISVIMPCYNAGQHVITGIQSVLAQTYSNLELVIVDDGSLDNTLEIIKTHRDPRIRIFSQSNQGVSAARNHALAESAGQYIAFLDADDTWAPAFLTKLHMALQLNPDAALAYCGWQNIGLSGGRGQPYIPPDYEKENKVEKLLAACPWPIHAALTRATIIKAAGGFSQRFTNAEDYALWLLIASHHKIVPVAEVLAFYHHHEGPQASKNRAKAAHDHWLVQREFIEKWPDIIKYIGKQRISELTHGELLRRAYVCYWERDIESARAIFKMVMKAGYGKRKDWKYMLPALLPAPVHRALLALASRLTSK